MAKSVKKSSAFPIKIGLEIHGYLNTKEKLFCKCSTQGDDTKLNTNVCPICTGQPGCKPMLPNKEAMRKVIQISFIMNCKINHDKDLIWQRKHYNWADLPKGYQNTISGAYLIPCAEHGEFKGIKIRETHLEEDPAQWNPETGKINYNRSGLPLIEIVTEPDFTSADQVISWLKDLLLHLSYIKAVRKNAGIKCDVNVSTYGERVEIKNINSLEKIQNAIEYEVKRQLENYEQGIEQHRETLAYDEKAGRTIKMREKESAEDYRFIPDPDLPVIKLNEKEIEKIEKELPENPDKKLEKLVKQYKIDPENAQILSRNIELVEFVENLAKLGVNVKENVSWITIELLRVLNYNKKTFDDVEIAPIHLAELIQALDKKQITELKAKQIMNSFIPKSFSIKEQTKSISKLSKDETEKFCKQAIQTNPKAVSDFHAGKQEALSYLMGEVMKLSQRRADSKQAKEILVKLLK